MEATRHGVPEQRKLKFSLLGQSDLLVSTMLLARCIFSSTCSHNASCFASQQKAINQIQMRTFKSQANATQTYASSYRHTRFPATSVPDCKGRVFLFAWGFFLQEQVLILTPKWYLLRRAKLSALFLRLLFCIDILVRNVILIPGIFRDSVHACKNRRGNFPCSHSMATAAPAGISPSSLPSITLTASQGITPVRARQQTTHKSPLSFHQV